MGPARSSYLQGAVFGLAAVSIWAGWSVFTRLAVTTSLDAWEKAHRARIEEALRQKGFTG